LTTVQKVPAFQGNDYVAKFRIIRTPTYSFNPTAKIQYSEDLANETYLGLTEEDYSNNPIEDMQLQLKLY
jgi:Fe(3+) dicitrate transport protein